MPGNKLHIRGLNHVLNELNIKPTPEQQVCVSWYGRTIQGEMVPDDTGNPLFADMLHVRITIQGTPAIAVFHPSSVMPAGEKAAQTAAVAEQQAAPPTEHHEQEPDGLRARCRQFKNEHWDNERNRLRTDALGEFYRLFREGVATRRQERPKTERSKAMRQPQQLTLDF